MSLRDSLHFVVTHPINRLRLSRGLVDWFAWQAKSRLRPGPHVHQWIAGTRLWARRGETGITGNLYVGLHEFEDMAFALHVLRPESLFVDVGANSGSYTILAAGAARARAISLEPVRSTFERLRANLKLNDLLDRVRAFNVAASGAPSRIRFTSGEDSTNRALAPGEAPEGAIEVEAVRLDDLLEGETPELVKIDVEGYEHAVIEGAKRALSPSGANAVLVELNGSGQRYGWSDDRVAAPLFAAGYRTYTYEPFSRKLTCEGTQLRREGNTLFIRDAGRAADLVASARRFEIKGVLV